MEFYNNNNSINSEKFTNYDDSNSKLRNMSLDKNNEVKTKVSSSSKKLRDDSEMDLSSINQGLWLVKVPKYIAERWKKCQPGDEAAKLKISRSQDKKIELNLSLNEKITCPSEIGEQEIPSHYKLDFSNLNQQTVGIFSEDSEKLSIEGEISQKLDCHPIVDATYMNLKLESIKKALQPKRTTQQLNRVVNNFKPVANHKSNIEFEAKKKSERKLMRKDKDVVLDILFSAFEKHQYYYLKDLVKLTKQPVVYIKEIVHEICNYNVKNPHKNMWELKPEYRHYNK